jgi:hypothetical protein
MKALRVGLFALASSALLNPAWSDVRTLRPVTTLAQPPNQHFTYFGDGVAIDGAHIIVLASNYEGEQSTGQYALLYRRGSNGVWSYRRALQSHSGPLAANMHVRMRNGLAVVQFDDQETIYEYTGGDYVPGQSATPIRHPGGIAISGNSVLIGGDGCDYDAVVYQKGANGLWGITGRLDDNQPQGECSPEGVAVELNYDYALIGGDTRNGVHAWRRNGTALDWLPAGTITVAPGGTRFSGGALGLQGKTAVTGIYEVFRRSGTTWNQQDSVRPVDYGNGAGEGFGVKFRDAVLLVRDTPSGLSDDGTYEVPLHPYAYTETSPGHFEHVAVLETLNTTRDFDISGRNVVASTFDWPPPGNVVVFRLPAEIKAPDPIVDDFEDRNLSGYTFTGGQFALATRGTDDVLAQNYANGLAVALVNNSDWTDSQRIEADIAPTFSVAGGWVGLVARYVDADNYYFVAIRNNNTFGIYRRLNGVNTLLREGTSAGPRPSHVTLLVNGGALTVRINNQYSSVATDRSLSIGRAGLATFQARADFDDVHVAGTTEPFFLLQKDYLNTEDDGTRPMTEVGGNWQIERDEFGNPVALQQTDASGSALAFTGTPVENQEISSLAYPVSYGSSQTGAWFGFVARYVDAKNYYYATVRATNQIDIRKVVNGVITVLASAPFTAPRGQYVDYRLRVIDDQLQLFVGNTMVASAHDHDIACGRYGIATYRTKATFEYITVIQP